MLIERIARTAVERRTTALAAALSARLPDAEVEEADGAVRLAGRGIARRLIEDAELRGLIR